MILKKYFIQSMFFHNQETYKANDFFKNSFLMIENITICANKENISEF